MQWGSKLDTLRQIRRRTGIVPQALRERPVLKPENLELYRDFEVLQSGRSVGRWGANPIPLTDFVAFLQIFPIADEDRRARWVRIMRRADSAVLSALSERQAAATDK